MIRIVRIDGRAKQGKTLPVFCAGDDGNNYIAKGANAGRLSLVREWLAARLGTILELPIPPFVRMEIHPSLLDYDATGDAQLIGKTTAFGSLRIENVNEFQYCQRANIDPELRARILLFDWWIANADRMLDEFGGNPNMLWDVSNKALVVIDHNLAFDVPFCDNFWNEHIFRDDKILWTSEFRSSQTKKMNQALSQLPKIWNELPDDWIEVECGISLNMAKGVLSRHLSDPFWGKS